jgi:hypothetical protein
MKKGTRAEGRVLNMVRGLQIGKVPYASGPDLGLTSIHRMTDCSLSVVEDRTRTHHTWIDPDLAGTDGYVSLRSINPDIHAAEGILCARHKRIKHVIEEAVSQMTHSAAFMKHEISAAHFSSFSSVQTWSTGLRSPILQATENGLRSGISARWISAIIFLAQLLWARPVYHSGR